MQTFLAWKPPLVSIMKLNIDGSRIGSMAILLLGALFEVNFAADSLAKMGHEMEMGIHCFVLPHGGITGVLQKDRDGLLRSRLINI
ncbi:unnamed protein product [Prunus armeniaca]